MDAAWPKDSRPYQARNTGIKTRAGVSFTRRLWETEGIIDVRFGSKADMYNAKGHVRFTPNNGHWRCTNQCLLWPIADIKAIQSLLCTCEQRGAQ